MERGKGAEKLLGLWGRPRLLPACPTAQRGLQGRLGPGNAPRGLGDPVPFGTEGAPAPRTCGFAQGVSAVPSLSVRLLPGRDSRAQPCGTVSFPHSTACFYPRFGKVRAAGPPSPRARGSPLAVASLPGMGGPTGRPGHKKTPLARRTRRGQRSPGRGAAAARRSREEGRAEARLLVRIVIFHQSPAICVSAPDRTPAVLLAGVTETTQRWRRANCICSPAHRSKLRPSHGAGKRAKGPCDMREI